jgi:hypothetical protein
MQSLPKPHSSENAHPPSSPPPYLHEMRTNLLSKNVAEFQVNELQDYSGDPIEESPIVPNNTRPQRRSTSKDVVAKVAIKELKLQNEEFEPEKPKIPLKEKEVESEVGFAPMNESSPEKEFDGSSNNDPVDDDSKLEETVQEEKVSLICDRCGAWHTRCSVSLHVP